MTWKTVDELDTTERRSQELPPVPVVCFPQKLLRAGVFFAPNPTKLRRARLGYVAAALCPTPKKSRVISRLGLKAPSAFGLGKRNPGNGLLVDATYTVTSRFNGSHLARKKSSCLLD